MASASASGEERRACGPGRAERQGCGSEPSGSGHPVWVGVGARPQSPKPRATGGPLPRTRTRARTLAGGDTWPRCLDEVIEGRGGHSCSPVGWRAREVGAREGPRTGKAALQPRGGFLELADARTEKVGCRWAVVGAAGMGHWCPDFAFQQLWPSPHPISARPHPN